MWILTAPEPPLLMSTLNDEVLLIHTCQMPLGKWQGKKRSICANSAATCMNEFKIVHKASWQLLEPR